MFVRHVEPISLTPAGLEGFCVSLNRPVVAIDPLPAGPARAAIALNRFANGERCLFIAVRSVETGAVAFFASDGLLGSRSRAMDEGLSFAERMGFLFDDDMLQSRGDGPPAGAANGAAGSLDVRRALECWCELTGEEPPRDLQASFVSDREEILEPSAVEPLDLLAGDGSPGASGSAEDGLLDDMVDLFDPKLEDTVPLSKFRSGPSEQEEPDPLAESTTLGRVAIVRRRVLEEAPEFETRLLASF